MSTLDRIDTSEYDDKTKCLADRLNTATNWGDTKIYSGIMEYGTICKCDSGRLCEHRLKYILDYIKENYE